MAVRNPLGGGSAAVTRYADNFATDSRANYEYLTGSEAADLSVVAGELAPVTLAGEIALTVPASLLTPTTDMWGKIKHKWATTEGTGSVGLILTYLDESNYLIGMLVRGAATDGLEIYKKDGGSFTLLGSAAPASPSTGQYNWLAFRKFGNLLIAEAWNADPASTTNNRLATATATLAGADATKFGSGISGKAGLRFVNIGHADHRYDDLTFARAPW